MPNQVTVEHEPRSRQRGQATVEFALVSITLLLFLVGALDLGRGIYYYNTLSDAARDAARAASVVTGGGWNTAGNSPGTYTSSAAYAGTSTIVGVAIGHVAGMDASLFQVTISATMGTASGMQLPVSVATQYTYNPASGALLGLGPITMTAQSTMFIR